MPGMSRPKVRRSLTSFIHVASKSGSEMGSASESEVKKPLKYKKKRKKSVQVKPKYDHRPHEVKKIKNYTQEIFHFLHSVKPLAE